MPSSPLHRITITRTPTGWSITRERETTGERYDAADLEEAFDYIRVIYDAQGKLKVEEEDDGT